jgi:hypothetical protein
VAAIDRTEKLATEHREAAESAYNAAVNAVSAPGDTAAELRNTRAADGAVRQLERLPAGERTQAAKAILEATNPEQLGAVAEAITTVGVNPGVVETLVAQQLPEVVPTPSRSPRHASRKRCYGTMHPGFVSMFAKDAACRYH